MTNPQLPTPSIDALQASQALILHIRQQIKESGGWISFADYMRMALYTPGLGYYSGGAAKFGGAGDFVTAPEISPLFGTCIANTLAHALQECGGDILEIGAGTGQLAAQILLELERLDALPSEYFILELSGELRERQRKTLQTLVPHLAHKTRWLDELPKQFVGVMVGNEVLDAMPCELVRFDGYNWLQCGVVDNNGDLAFEHRTIENLKLEVACEGFPHIPQYTTEIQLEAQGFINALAASLQFGMILLIDYGFPASEFYHPERSMGTLMGHYRHHSIHDPFFLPGLTDITCHVDFSAIYNAADQAGLSLEGYTSQASYLIDAGILDRAAQMEIGSVEYLRMSTALQKLTSNAEMGELFKVIAFSKELQGKTVPGLGGRDRSGEL
ncbi:class I SAM-dependent methyltransferase [Iodobacter arcticus]|uniref:Class I SAM-dependent methyltransferase n=1 Tax=Iodobacter arcticus TaxID=590593 RepID=A0ABW2QZA2_9NEIS